MPSPDVFARVLVGSFVLLGVIEFVDAPLIDGWGFAVAFGVLFLLAAWLVWARKYVAGVVLGGLLAAFEVLGFAGWEKDDAVAWVIAVATLVVAIVALVAIAGYFASRRRAAPQNVA